MLETHRHDSLTALGTATVGGIPAYKYQTDYGTTVAIADAAPHYPLSFDESAQREWQFADWNKVTPVAPPPAGQIAHLPSDVTGLATRYDRIPIAYRAAAAGSAWTRV